MKRIFLTGATGQIGWELARTLMAMGQVVIPARDRYDLARPESLRPLLDAVRPDVNH